MSNTVSPDVITIVHAVAAEGRLAFEAAMQSARHLANTGELYQAMRIETERFLAAPPDSMAEEADAERAAAFGAQLVTLHHLCKAAALVRAMKVTMERASAISSEAFNYFLLGITYGRGMRTAEGLTVERIIALGVSDDISQPADPCHGGSKATDFFEKPWTMHDALVYGRIERQWDELVLATKWYETQSAKNIIEINIETAPKLLRLYRLRPLRQC